MLLRKQLEQNYNLNNIAVEETAYTEKQSCKGNSLDLRKMLLRVVAVGKKQHPLYR